MPATRRFVSTPLALLTVATFAASPADAAEPRPKVVILATGGTIAGAQRAPHEAAYRPGQFSVDELVRAVPALAQVADITGEQVANIGSQAMTHAVWLRLAERVNASLAGEAHGVVVTHGTDTLEETAYFLSLVVKSEKPVVLVGAMRPATSLGADGPMNLYNAVVLAAEPGARGRGPLVLLSDEIHFAREVTKTNTTQLDTFKSPNRGRAGLIESGEVQWYPVLDTRHTVRSEFSLEGLTAESLPRVDIVYAYANAGREAVDALVQSGAKGLVLAGVGNGNASDAMLAALAEAARRGVAVVRSTRVGSGRVDRNREVNDDELGFVAAGDLNPAKARILLMLALTRTTDARRLQAFFDEY